MASLHGDYEQSINSHHFGIEKNGWELLQLNFLVTEAIHSVTLFVYSAMHTAYFDDFKIVRFNGIPQKEAKNHLSIVLPQSSKDSLNHYIEMSANEAVIPSVAKKYVDAFVFVNHSKDTVPVKMRLKGDWTDHVKTGKVSYRIKVKGEHSIFGLKTFSIQHPKTRNYMHEWFIHQLMDSEDILNTKYDFITADIDGLNQGVYALEEHFDKQLIESRERREGPIVKFDESGFWDVQKLFRIDSVYQPMPAYASSLVIPFKKNRTSKSPSLRREFNEAQTLLSLYKNHHQPLSDMFDVKKLAQFYAFIELGFAHHGLAWHNRRFYLNPVTDQLEEVAYDLIPANESSPHLLMMEKLNQSHWQDELSLNQTLLYDEPFKKYYFAFLKKYSSESYLLSQFETLKPSIEEFESLIANEEGNYQFTPDYYLQRAHVIDSLIPILDEKWTTFLLNPSPIDSQYTVKTYDENPDEVWMKNISIHTYISEVDSTQFDVTVQNYHLNPIQIIGYTTKASGDYVIKIEEPIELKAYHKQAVDTHFTLNEKPKQIVYQFKNRPNEIHKKKVIKWNQPQTQSGRMELKNEFNKNSSYYSIQGNQLVFKQGHYSINELIYIPSLYQVTFLAGTQIDFIQGGGIILNNRVIARGTETDSIIFNAKDADNHGLSILSADSVIMDYVSFNHLNSLHYKNWHLTGALSIYESQVQMNHCSSSWNLSEDAFNFIRSNIKVQNCQLSHTFSDAIDTDFCQGEISHSVFSFTGNDALGFFGKRTKSI